MTDKETFVEMLKKACIEYDDDGTFITIEAGYIGFVSSIKFTESGDLISIEAYE